MRGVIVLSVLAQALALDGRPARCGEPAPADREPAVLEAFSEGEGRPLVMLGGGIAGAAGFAPHAKLLASEYRVIRLQALRNERAQSRQPLPLDYSIGTESAALARSLDKLGITEPIHLVGHSFGALVALDFALDHPDRIETLVLCEPPAFWAVPAAKLRADEQMRAMTELVRTFRPNDEPTDEQLIRFQAALGKPGLVPPAPGEPGWSDWAARRSALRGLSAVAEHSDDPERLRRFPRPVLIVTGAKTVGFHRRINDILGASLPVAERVELPGDHGAPNTAREEFVAELRAFLARHQ